MTQPEGRKTSAQRGKEATPRLRGRRGMEQRQRRLDRDPLCADCRTHGFVTIATRVDHIVPLSKGGPDTDENTRNLCEPCHEKRTAEQFGFKQKQTIGTDGWPV